VTYSKDSAPVEVRHLAHMIPPYFPHSLIWIFFRTCLRLTSVRYSYNFMYLTDHYCQKSHTGKLHSLLKNIYCTQLCAYNGDCQNISDIVVKNITLQLQFQWILELSFSHDIAGKVFIWIHFTFFLYCLSYFVTCVEPKINITFKNQ
jgi:hypothetical protein